MALSLFIILSAWSLVLLNLSHIVQGIDPINSVLLALAATFFALRYRSRFKNRTQKKALSLTAHYRPER